MLKFEDEFNIESAGQLKMYLKEDTSFHSVLINAHGREFKYLKYRRMLIDWMFELGESIHLLPRTCHTAAVMVDICFARKNFEKKVWQTLTIACLALAAKHIEKDERKH
jgi:hypothetical protein